MAEHAMVIGAGVYGASVAAALARRGARVTIVEAAAPAGGTSGATFSWTNSCGKQPRVYHDLNVAGMEAHRRLAAETPGADWYHEDGNLEWADDEAGRERLRAKVAGVLAYGYEAQWLDRAQALRLEPDMDPDRLPADEIAYFPREGWIEPGRLVAHLLSRAASDGAELLRGDAVAGLDVSDGLVRSARLASGRQIHADAFFDCAGPQAAAVAALAGLSLPMRNTRGVIVYTGPVDVSLTRVIHAPRVHMRPDSARRLLLHAEELDNAVQATDPGEGGAPPWVIEHVLEASRELYPGLRAASVESVRVGERPIPGDGLPVLGRAAGLPNLHFAVSHSGATLSVHAGDLVAAEALGEDRGDALAPFRFERLNS